MNPNDSFPIAIHILVYLAERPRKLLAVEEIADGLDLKVTTVRRILRGLKREGAVTLKSGPKGGWGLAKPPRSISLRVAYDASAVILLPIFRSENTDSEGSRFVDESEDQESVYLAVNSLFEEAESLLATRFERVSLKDLLDQVKVFRAH